MHSHITHFVKYVLFSLVAQYATFWKDFEPSKATYFPPILYFADSVDGTPIKGADSLCWGDKSGFLGDQFQHVFPGAHDPSREKHTSTTILFIPITKHTRITNQETDV